MATLFMSPAEDAVLASRVSIVLKASDGTGTFSDYSLTLGGLALPEPELHGGVYVLLLDTGRYPNGEQVLRAEATHSTAGSVEQEITVSVSNSLQSNVEFQVWRVANQRDGEHINRANLHLKTFDLPASLRLQYWTQIRLLTEATPEVGSLDALEPEDLEELDELFATGQPVATVISKLIPEFLDRPAAELRYASHIQLAYPGQELTAMLRQEPRQYVSWWTTPFERGVKLRRNAAECEVGTEVWYALYKNLDGMDAGIYRFKVGGGAGNPVVTWEEAVDLTEECPDAIDFCVHEDKVFVVRASNTLIYVFDRDAGEYLVALSLVKESRKPMLLETVNETPVVLCTNDAVEEDRTRAWQLVFPQFKPLWTIDETATATRVLSDGTDYELYIAADDKLYSSTGGTAVAGLVHTFEDTISAIGASGIKPIAGLENGQLLIQTGVTWNEPATLPGPVLAASAWKADGETQRAVAGRESLVLIEEGQDGTWGAGITLTPPEPMTAAVSRITGLENFERVVKEAAGTEGQPDFTPAEYDRRLLVLTGDDGLFATLQYSTLSPVQGAFLSHEHNELTLVPLTAFIPTDPIFGEEL